MALLQAGEIDHPGLDDHTGHIRALDERIETLILADGLSSSSGSEE